MVVCVVGTAKLGVTGVIADLPGVVSAGSEVVAGVDANDAAVPNASIAVLTIDGATGTIADVPTITAAGAEAVAGVVAHLAAVSNAGFGVVAGMVANVTAVLKASQFTDMARGVADFTLVVRTAGQ